MADVCQSAPRSKKAYWTKNARESSDDSESFVPGVTVTGNRRPTKMQGRKTKEIKAKIPVQQPVIENILSKDIDHELSRSLNDSSVMSRKPIKGSRQVTLKDLTHADKKRIADLIKELAKVGDEREKAVGQLHQERSQFEKQVLQLVEQQEKILNEREDIQAKLFQCQDLLTKYQNKILEKQEEINTSFREMSNTPPEKKEPVRRKLIQRSRSQSPDQESESGNGYSWESHAKHPSPSRYRNIIQPSDMYPARPFTSKIDKEIALQRTFTERDILSTIICQSAAEQNPESAKIGYRDQAPALKTFREPIMSSTQKSSEINQCISGSQDENFHSLVPDSSPRSSRLSDMEVPLHGAHVKDRDSSRSKVGFKDKHLEVEYENAKMHSPHLPSVSAVFGDKQFMDQYKKLSQTDRKRELLRQRENLLDEQKRLKMILRTQEQQLRKKQDQLHKQQALQKERLAYFEKNGKFPLGRPQTDFDNDIDENQENIPVERPRVEGVVSSQTYNQNLVTKHISSPKVSQAQTYGDIGDDGSLFGGEVKKLDFDRPVDDGIEEEAGIMHDLTPETRSRTSVGTSPIHEARQQRLLQSMATSPIRIEQSRERNSFHTPTRVADAATSVSHVNMSPRSQKSTESVEDLILGRNFQGNLPLSSNRGRSHQSPAQSGPRTPGDKTLSVVEIVNSLDQSPSWAGSNHGNKSPVRRQYGTPPIHNISIQEEVGEDEESRVLEDVFFVRG